MCWVAAQLFHQRKQSKKRDTLEYRRQAEEERKREREMRGEHGGGNANIEKQMCSKPMGTKGIKKANPGNDMRIHSPCLNQT